MADWINAGLGAALGAPIGPVLDLLIEQVKFAVHCKEECSTLVEYLTTIKPMLELVSEQCQGNPVLKDWLRGFEKCVREGSDLVAKCKSDEKWYRWKVVRYGKQILKVKERIETSLRVAPVAQITLQNPSSSTSKLVQEVPATILGMDRHFEVVRALVLEGFECKTSSCVSIRGMGGAGKTLLAQMVNNDKEIDAKFGSRSIFWITVGRDASISSIYQSMRKYLDVPDGRESLIDQRTILKETFSKRSVLLILDDVWGDVYVEQKSMTKWLSVASGPGNVTVVTTRMESVTRDMKASEEVILLLSEEDSWRLFCIHAFGSEIPQLDQAMQTLAEGVCKECNCLPLALKVIGCVMNGESDLGVWKSILKRMQASGKVNKSVDEELFKRLQISYDHLDDPQKICFLYFAAFPEDYEVPPEALCKMWIAEGLFDQNDRDEEEVLYQAKFALNELRKRCLIQSGERYGKWVKMHDILRDLAVHLTSEGEEPTRESLFTFAKGNDEVFQTSRLGLQALKVKRMSLWGFKNIVGSLNTPYLRVCVLYSCWEKYERLRIDSDSKCGFVEGNFFEDMKDLRYLQIYGIDSMETLSASIGGMEFLQHLDLQWFKVLKELPKSIGGLRSLQHLNLQGCLALEELPESIGGLGFLQHLNMDRCLSLKELPKTMGGLGSLQHLDLGSCKTLEVLPESIGELGSLEHLNIEGCVALKEIPKSIGGLRSLQYLNLERCHVLKELPKSIGDLGFVQHLSLGSCSSLKVLPESIGGLGSLQHLNLEWCGALKVLPESIGDLGSLQYLNLEYCIALEELPKSIGGLGSLQHLNLGWCVRLEELPKNIKDLGSLEHLNLEMCETLTELPKSIGDLIFLQYLNLQQCRALNELPESIGELRSLQHLNIERCEALKELPKSIGELRSLQHLNIERCEALKKLPKSIGGLGFLQHLNLRLCEALNELPKNIGDLGSMQHFNLGYCLSLKVLPVSIGDLGSLQHLNLEGCVVLEELPKSIGDLGSLQHLNLDGCVALKELPESIGELRSLQHLNLEWCIALKVLSENIGDLGSLQHLNLGYCVALKKLPESIGELRSLQHLNLRCCEALTKLPKSIRGLGTLQNLNLESCLSLKELPESIGDLRSLQHLNLEECKALKELSESIGGLGCLQELNLKGCVVKNFPTFSKRDQLKILF